MLSENAKRVLENYYLRKNENGELETPQDLFRRVAHNIASVDIHYGVKDFSSTENQFYNLMENQIFLPNSPTLLNAGKPEGQLSACFVVPIDDSIISIYKALGDAAIIQQSGGGTGFSFSKIRPKNDSISSNSGVASGPISFIRLFNDSTNVIKQGGIRRGANIAILDVHHPDIKDFIQCKNDEDELTNFNISVGITNSFMDAVKNNKKFNILNPNTNEVVRQESANEIFNMIVQSAYETGEPGILFLDNIEKDNMFHDSERIKSTNPCGEQPLLDYESCNLGSINLSNMCCKNDNDIWIVDYEKLSYTVKIAVHFLDNVIDANHYPLPVIDEKTKGSRKIGLGVMGWADLLFKLGVPYNSMRALDLASELMKFIKETANEKSKELAQLRGDFPRAKEIGIYQKRNATLTTIAPTGTISVIADCSSGIEPVYSLSHTKRIRNKDEDEELTIFNETLLSVLKNNKLDDEEIIGRIKRCGTIANIEQIPDKIKEIFVTAFEVPIEFHVKMQAAFQKYTDNAVSKTINMKESTTIDDIKFAFLLAYDLGCKGITVYRNKSRDTQVLNIGGNNQRRRKMIKPEKRPEKLSGCTLKIKSGCGTLYVTINKDGDEVIEVFINTGKGGCHSQSEAIARLISTALRSGVSTKAIIEQLKEIKCDKAMIQTNGKIRSCPEAIAQVIQEETGLFISSNKKCSCGAELIHDSGCLYCPVCGLSNCQ